MINGINSLMIEYKKFPVIKPSELDSFIFENEFSEKTENQITEIYEMFKDADKILFILNYVKKKYVLDYFMTICNNKATKDKLPVLQDIDGVKYIKSIILPEPIKNWNRNKIDKMVNKMFPYAIWSINYGFLIQKDDGISGMQINIAPFTREPITIGRTTRMRRTTRMGRTTGGGITTGMARRYRQPVNLLRRESGYNRLIICEPSAKKTKMRKLVTKKITAKKTIVKKPTAKKTTTKRLSAKKATAKR